jgi:hypothetical protein
VACGTARLTQPDVAARPASLWHAACSHFLKQCQLRRVAGLRGIGPEPRHAPFSVGIRPRRDQRVELGKIPRRLRSLLADAALDELALEGMNDRVAFLRRAQAIARGADAERRHQKILQFARHGDQQARFLGADPLADVPVVAVARPECAVAPGKPCVEACVQQRKLRGPIHILVFKSIKIQLQGRRHGLSFPHWHYMS